MVLGAAAPVPWRAREAESRLVGKVPTREVIGEAADAAMADAMPLADNRYKVELFRTLLIDALEEVGGTQAYGLSMPWRRMWAISATTSSVLLP